MRAARRRGVLGVASYETGPSSRVRSRAPSVRHLLRDGYKRGLHAFKVDKDIMDALVHLMRKRGGGAEGSNHRKASSGDVALRHALN